VETPGGDVGLLKKSLEGLNADRKAATWGKMLFSASDSSVIVTGHVPPDLATDTGVTLSEWLMCLMEHASTADGCTVRPVDGATFEVTVDAAAETFPFKLCDAMTERSTVFLRERKVVPEKKKTDEEDDEEVDYAAALGMEW